LTHKTTTYLARFIQLTIVVGISKRLDGDTIGSY
jgi:hypothetical protein